MRTVRVPLQSYCARCGAPIYHRGICCDCQMDLAQNRTKRSEQVAKVCIVTVAVFWSAWVVTWLCG